MKAGIVAVNQHSHGHHYRRSTQPLDCFDTCGRHDMANRCTYAASPIGIGDLVSESIPAPAKPVTRAGSSVCSIARQSVYGTMLWHNMHRVARNGLIDHYWDCIYLRHSSAKLCIGSMCARREAAVHNWQCRQFLTENCLTPPPALRHIWHNSWSLCRVLYFRRFIG